MSDTAAIVGIVDYSGPAGSNAGFFQLPLGFDQLKHSANWVPKGPQVEKAQTLQPILGTNKAASGWEVWKHPKGHKEAGKPCTANTSKGEYILMFRPKHVSEAVNAIYGNVSKRHLVRHQGEVTPVAPGADGDRSVLSNAALNQHGVRDFGDDYQMNVPQNPETTAAAVTAPPDSTGTLQTTQPEE